MSARDNSDSKISLAVRSTRVCRSLFDEGDIGCGLRSGGAPNEIVTISVTNIIL